MKDKYHSVSQREADAARGVAAGGLLCPWAGRRTRRLSSCSRVALRGTAGGKKQRVGRLHSGTG